MALALARTTPPAPAASRAPPRTSARHSVWSAILGALVILLILLMLAAFHQVVQGAVEQSEVRRQSMAQQAEETSRCIGIGNNQARKDCLERLTSAPSQNQ